MSDWVNDDAAGTSQPFLPPSSTSPMHVEDSINDIPCLGYVAVSGTSILCGQFWKMRKIVGPCSACLLLLITTTSSSTIRTLTSVTGAATGDRNMIIGNDNWGGAAAAGGRNSGAAKADGFTSQDVRSGGGDFVATDGGCGDPTDLGTDAGGNSACRNCGQGKLKMTVTQAINIADHHFTDGHFARECLEPRKNGSSGCFNCGEEGHNKADCTNPRAARPFDGECRLCNKSDKYSLPRSNVSLLTVSTPPIG